MANSGMVAVGVIFFLILICAGPLLPTWMFLNSIQLIFHLPLIKSDMPSHAFFFMTDYLNKLRLNFDWTEKLAEEWMGNPSKQDYEIIKEDSFYTTQIK